MATYPNKEFQDIYNGIIASMGTDDQLKANLEAALRPLYEQSLEQLQQRRRENNAAIDVDAASRGMGNSTWVTDAKLRQLKDIEGNIATLDANYNNQLFGQLQDAIKDRDANAYNQAMQWWNIGQKGKGGGGSDGVPEWLKKLLEGDQGKGKDITFSMTPNEKILGNPRVGRTKYNVNPNTGKREKTIGVDLVNPGQEGQYITRY